MARAAGDKVKMISTVISSSSLPWLVGEFFIFLVAISGGVLVFRGLWIEKKADESEKKEHLDAFIDEVRLLKLKSKRGWKMLMWGIALETAVAGVFAARDGWEIRQMKIIEANNDPIKRPISEISAIVDFKVKEDKPSETPNWGMPRVAGVFLCESNWCTNTNIPGFFAGTTLVPLEADNFDRYFDGKTLEYILHFHLEGMGEILMGGKENRTVEWALEHVRFMDITTKFLPHDAEILSGSAVLTINSGPQKWFVIPPQKDSDPNSGKYGFGYQVIALMPTNVVETPKK
jgi:hypothetical protein